MRFGLKRTPVIEDPYPSAGRCTACAGSPDLPSGFMTDMVLPSCVFTAALPIHATRIALADHPTSHTERPSQTTDCCQRGLTDRAKSQTSAQTLPTCYKHSEAEEARVLLSQRLGDPQPPPQRVEQPRAPERSRHDDLQSIGLLDRLAALLPRLSNTSARVTPPARRLCASCR